jgi:hypothetical protein
VPAGDGVHKDAPQKLEIAGTGKAAARLIGSIRTKRGSDSEVTGSTA